MQVVLIILSSLDYSGRINHAVVTGLLRSSISNQDRTGTRDTLLVTIH